MFVRHRLVSILLALSLLAASGAAFASQQQQYDRITADVVQLRQLELLHPLDIEVQSRDQLRDWLLADIAEDYSAADQADDLRVLVIFGLAEPRTDLAQLQTDILGDQVAGYYNPETREMVVVSESGGENLSASDEITFAHETIHALQDQHFDLIAVQGDPETVDDDRWLATTALIEGDATTGQIQYLIANPLLLAGLQAELQDLDTSSLDAAPPFFERTLLFPYDEGADFVSFLYDQGGWDAVNAAYANPPASTEQIIHPEKYLAGEMPMPVVLIDPLGALGPEWRIIDQNVLGELYTSIVLASHDVSRGEARQAAEGWGGDQYLVVGTEDRTALVWRSVWDSEEDAQEFFSLLARHELRRHAAQPVANAGGTLRFDGDGMVGEIHRAGSDVLYVLAPDEATLDTLVQSQRGG